MVRVETVVCSIGCAPLLAERQCLEWCDVLSAFEIVCKQCEACHDLQVCMEDCCLWRCVVPAGVRTAYALACTCCGALPGGQKLTPCAAAAAVAHH
jgi:hypothetical protein